jgi:hypothetical protein
MLLALLAGCTSAPSSLPPTDNASPSETASAEAKVRALVDAAVSAAPDERKARAVADQVADAVVAQDPELLHSLMVSEYRTASDAKATAASLDAMLKYSGTASKATYKNVESGTVGTLSGVRGTSQFWYLLDTSKGEGGPYYLKIDVVDDGGRLAVSTFAIVSFYLNGPPDYLK